MMIPGNTHWIAALAFERMLYCLAEGTALAALMALALRLVPKKNSQTRFTVWFTTLLAVVLLPIVGVGTGSPQTQPGAAPTQALFTISTAWAEYIIVAWAVLAGAGLLRLAAGLWQVRRLRRGCAELDSQHLSAELQGAVADLRKRRSVSILISPTLDVPTAIGFLRPAILIPGWLTELDAAEELKHVLLHELAHLRRWDDWTNVAQKLVKSVLFFHPGVWWIERELSLDREMACDDAVLAQTSSPKIYAQCLARVAAKSFLRRQMALAQAAVNRMKQLSLRVTRILDGNRPQSTRLWKPAVPMVMMAAGLCAISTSTMPELVRLSDDQPRVGASSVASHYRQPTIRNGGADPVFSGSAATAANLAKFTPASMNAQTSPREWRTSLKSRAGRGPLSPGGQKPAKPAIKQIRIVTLTQNTATADQSSIVESQVVQTQVVQTQVVQFQVNQSPVGQSNDQFDGAATLMFLARYSAPEKQHDSTPPGNVVLLVVTGRRITSSSFAAWTWQISTWELRAVAPANHPTKQIPRKT
jgi:beta-lactamase regulating signal transducer with metallopeptidase domain